ncbi:hypothetical protein TEA_000881 [Camellia sinensis var. sinensis]|uniref:Uncharacterized protein n=1 Tax=Camellia sinensis var. sinensis TaxID=542762 RepID=A0A4S4F4A7_CAMSN|nr:hypothetical protein TEA_000881 [Camellia sinensis var. sinensis]
MNKLLEFGRKAMFYVRVLSGYEERRIRSYRLQLQKRLQQAEERKAAIKRIPEQIILSEVRRMVEEMQALNRKLEETNSGGLAQGEKYAVAIYATILRDSGWLISGLFLRVVVKIWNMILEFDVSLGFECLNKWCACSQEVAIEEYFKPIDKEAEIIMKTQLEGEEKTVREMMKAMQTQALLEQAEAERLANVKKTEANQQEKASASTTQAEVR